MGSCLLSLGPPQLSPGIFQSALAEGGRPAPPVPEFPRLGEESQLPGHRPPEQSTGMSIVGSGAGGLWEAGVLRGCSAFSSGGWTAVQGCGGPAPSLKCGYLCEVVNITQLNPLGGV